MKIFFTKNLGTYAQFIGYGSVKLNGRTVLVKFEDFSCGDFGTKVFVTFAYGGKEFFLSHGTMKDCSIMDDDEFIIQMESFANFFTVDYFTAYNLYMEIEREFKAHDPNDNMTLLDFYEAQTGLPITGWTVFDENCNLIVKDYDQSKEDLPCDNARVCGVYVTNGFVNVYVGREDDKNEM